MAGLSAGGGAASYITGAFGGGGSSTAASAGLFANPVGLALAGGQLAFGIANMIQQDKVATQQAYNQAYNTTYNNIIGQWRTEQANKQIANAFSAKVEYVKNQIENNFIAAQASWTAEQMRTNDVYGRAAYQSQALQKMLTEAMGTAAAREVYGKSAKRGALVATLGAYGRTRAQQVDQLMSETTQAQMRMQQTQQQMQAANKMAIAQLAVLPQSQFFTPQGLPSVGGGSGLNTALQIGQLGMQAFQTGWQATPVKGSFLGIPKVA